MFNTCFSRKSSGFTWIPNAPRRALNGEKGHGLAVSLCRHRSFREALEHPRGEENKGFFYGKIRVFYGILWDLMGFYRIL